MKSLDHLSLLLFMDVHSISFPAIAVWIIEGKDQDIYYSESFTCLNYTLKGRKTTKSL